MFPVVIGLMIFIAMIAMFTLFIRGGKLISKFVTEAKEEGATIYLKEKSPLPGYHLVSRQQDFRPPFLIRPRDLDSLRLSCEIITIA